MKTNLKLFLICVAGFTLTVSLADASPRGGSIGGAHFSPMPAQSAGTLMRSGAGTFHSDRFDRFHHRTFIFVDTFGFPFFSPFPYYGYYPYGYPYPYGYYPNNYYGYDYGAADVSGYSYGDRSRIAALQRRLARAGYYHGAIDGIMGSQTRRAIRAYEQTHNMPA